MSKHKRKNQFGECPHPSLDLHQIKHDEVRFLLIPFIEKYWNSGEVVEIITGNSDEMKRIVIEVLDEYKLEHQIGDPLNVHNTGVIHATLI